MEQVNEAEAEPAALIIASLTILTMLLNELSNVFLWMGAIWVKDVVQEEGVVRGTSASMTAGWLLLPTCYLLLPSSSGTRY